VGEAVRWYCRPIRNASELTRRVPPMVRHLGEDLVLAG
jgi:hypothetical protein